MHILKTVLAIIAASFLLASCATGPSPIVGSVYTNLKGPNHGEYVSKVKKNITSQTGEACASSILGMIATGDASINTARKSVGIKKIQNVDYKFYNILGLYTKTCTLVTGI